MIDPEKFLIDATYQKAFKKIFEPFIDHGKISADMQSRINTKDGEDDLAAALFIDKDASITQAHFEDICKNYSSLLVDADPTQVPVKQATLLMSLAIMMTNYSSVNFLGVVGDSPAALRQYAIALLNKANALAPELYDDLEQAALRARAERQYRKVPERWRPPLAFPLHAPTVFEKHIKHLYGTAYSCTAMLTDEMLDKSKDLKERFPAFQAVFNLAFPNDWL